MKKTLLFFLYAKNNIDSNMAYYLNQLCLKEYINVFDNIIFWVSLDDLTNILLKNKAIKWITDTIGNKQVLIKFRQNNFKGEAEMLQEEVLNKIDTYKNELIFFAHCKGCSKFDLEKNKKSGNSLGIEHGIITNSLLTWTTALYYFSFVDLFEMENKLTKKTFRQVFYGPLLRVEKKVINLNHAHYAGTFYWINPEELKNMMLKTGKKIPKLFNRYFAEDFPGSVCSSLFLGAGLSSHKDKTFNLDETDFNPYVSQFFEWVNIFDILGEKNGASAYAEYKTKEALKLYNNKNNTNFTYDVLWEKTWKDD